jgi:hypothetical protein
VFVKASAAANISEATFSICWSSAMDFNLSNKATEPDRPPRHTPAEGFDTLNMASARPADCRFFRCFLHPYPPAGRPLVRPQARRNVRGRFVPIAATRACGGQQESWFARQLRLTLDPVLFHPTRNGHNNRACKRRFLSLRSRLPVFIGAPHELAPNLI